MRTQPQSLEEETELIRRHLEGRRMRQTQQSGHQPTRVAPGAREDGEKRGGGGEQDGGKKGVDFDDVAKLLRETGDPRKVVERLREMGYEVEEVVDRGGLVQGADYRYGWIVRVGGRYIAITSGHRLGRGDVGDYAAMELQDEGVARNFLVGRYWGTAWGDPDFVRRAAEAAHYERELDRWMREELGKAGYSVERVEWPENAPVRGFTYIIRDSQGNKIGEVQVAKVGFKYSLVNTGLPPAVLASGDPRKAAAYFVYKHVTGDEGIAWKLVAGDERAKELFVSKARYGSELDARERWFRELTERGLKPIAHSKIDGRPVVSEGDLFLDEKTGVTYRVVLERQGDRITMKLVPASERDELRLALKSLEAEGFKVVDDKTVERDGIRYTVRVEERDGKKVLRLEPHPEDAKKATEREVWWELWRQGFAKRGEYAVKDGVKYRVEVVEQGDRYVAKLTPVGPASPEEEPRKYRSGDRRGSVEGMRQIQFTIERLGLEKEFRPEDLRFGAGGRPRDVPYFPVVDEAFYGAFGVPLSQAVFSPAGRELYWRYSTATLPGPQVQGFTLPERQALERAAEVQRLYAERFADVWTPLTFRAPTERDINWRTAVATATETLTFWVPIVKGAAALAAARGVKVPGLTAERTVAAGYGVRLPRVPGDYFEVHFVEPRRVVDRVRGALVAEGVGKGAAIRGAPGHWELVFARTGKPEPGWAFELAVATYRDVAEWLKRLPSIGIRTELRPRVLRFTEVRGFARDLPEPPRLETPQFEPQPRGREVRVEWRETPKAPDDVKPPVREPPRAPEPEPPRRGLVAKAEETKPRAVAKAAQVEEELARPVRAELPVAKTWPKAEEGLQRAEGRRIETALVEAEAPLRTPAARAPERVAEERVVAWPAETPIRGLGPAYILAWRHEFVAPAIQPFEVRVFETPAISAYETSRETETARYDVWTAEVPGRGTRAADAAVSSGRPEGGFPTPPPPPTYVRGGWYGGRESAHVLSRPPRLARRGWRVYEVLRI